MCDGSNITKGIWKDQRTPNLEGAYLMGVKSLEKVKNIFDVKVVTGDPASLLEGTLDKTNPDKTSPGFCWQQKEVAPAKNEKKIFGCDEGTRYQNSVKIQKMLNQTEGDDKMLVNTVKVVWIMKCW